MQQLGVEVNRAIDDVSANLTLLIDVIRDTNQTIRNTLNNLTYVPLCCIGKEVFMVQGGL